MYVWGRGGIGSYFSELGAVVGQIGGTFYTKIVISQSLFQAYSRLINFFLRPQNENVHLSSVKQS